MWDKIKTNLQLVFGFVLLVVSGAFFYERQKRKEADAIADNKEVLDKVNDINRQVEANKGKLESEESKRADIKKEADNAKRDDSDDPSDFLNKR